MLKIDLTVGPFYAAVRQATIVTSEERRGVDFVFGGGKIVLPAHGAELGESHVELPIAYDGDEIGITLDPRYLSDFLKVLDPEQNFTVELRNAESAALCIRKTATRTSSCRWPGMRENWQKPLAASQRNAGIEIWPAVRRAIGNVLSELMSRRGYARVQSAAAYDAAWREAAGPLAAKYTRPGLVRRGTLEVMVANSTLMQELGFQNTRSIGSPGKAPARRRDRKPSLSSGEHRIKWRLEMPSRRIVVDRTVRTMMDEPFH